jgi:hypothetical protein
VHDAIAYAPYELRFINQTYAAYELRVTIYQSDICGLRVYELRVTIYQSDICGLRVNVVPLSCPLFGARVKETVRRGASRKAFPNRVWERERNCSTRSVEEGIPKQSLGTRKYSVTWPRHSQTEFGNEKYAAYELLVTAYRLFCLAAVVGHLKSAPR